ncbi:MAG: LCP family protein [Microthrixaceae bacterium]
MTRPSNELRGVDLDLPEHGTGVRAARRAASQVATPAAAPAPAGPSRRWMTVFTAVLVLAVLVGAALAFVGVETLRDSSAGRRVTSLDPSEPGFEGILESTPTLLVVHDNEGALASAALLALNNDDLGGSVILLPPSVKVGDGKDAATLAVTYAFGGTPEVMRGAGEAVAGVGVEDIVVVDDQRWRDLVAPLAPLSIDNPDAVPGFAAGPLSLTADQVGPWLEARDPREGELAAVYRQQLFWESWIRAVAKSTNPAAVPGELDSGLGRFVRGLANGPLQVATVAVTDVIDSAGNHVFPVDRAALQRTITDLVPFPVGTALAPRTRVRLLDGTGDQNHVRSVAPTVVASASTIVVVGNADRFDYTATEIRYHQPGERAAAERLREALGAGRVIEDIRPIDSFDVTIVLGTDI